MATTLLLGEDVHGNQELVRAGLDGSWLAR